MAVKPLVYVELQIQVDDGTREAINRLPQLLMKLLTNGNLGTFTSEENRGAEAVFFFESIRMVSAICKVRELVVELNLVSQSSVVVRADVLPRESDLSLHLRDFDLWKDRIEEFGKRRPKARARRPKVYDYYAVPLPDGRFGHLQYVHHDPKRGDLVQVLSVITAEQASCVDELVDAKPLFPPVQTAVTVGILVGGWILIGNRERLGEFRFPTFRGTNSLFLRRHEPGIYEDWWLWSGGENWRPVGKLNDEHRNLEYDVGWPPLDLARRIATGENEYDQFL